MQTRAHDFAAWIAKRIHDRRLRERVIALNPGYVPGTPIRGWHRTPSARHYAAVHRLVPKGDILRQLGRAQFQAIPKAVLLKQGRRVFVRARDVQQYCQPAEQPRLLRT